MKLLLASLAAIAPVFASASSCEPIAPVVGQLLSAYSAKDLDQVAGHLARDDVLVLGSDVSEIARSASEVSTLFQADFRLWGSARFGAPRFMDCRIQGGLGTAAFDVPFEMKRNDGSSLSVTVRFLTVWNRDSTGRWLLTQSMNSTPTVGASAAEILKKHED